MILRFNKKDFDVADVKMIDKFDADYDKLLEEIEFEVNNTREEEPP